MDLFTRVLLVKKHFLCQKIYKNTRETGKGEEMTDEPGQSEADIKH